MPASVLLSLNALQRSHYLCSLITILINKTLMAPPAKVVPPRISSSSTLPYQRMCIFFFFTQIKKDATVHAGVCPHSQLSGDDGRASLEQEHYRLERKIK